eukprot:4184038-Amphidinium_carterae.4
MIVEASSSVFHKWRASAWHCSSQGRPEFQGIRFQATVSNLRASSSASKGGSPYQHVVAAPSLYQPPQREQGLLEE